MSINIDRRDINRNVEQPSPQESQEGRRVVAIRQAHAYMSAIVRHWPGPGEVKLGAAGRRRRRRRILLLVHARQNPFSASEHTRSAPFLLPCHPRRLPTRFPNRKKLSRPTKHDTGQCGDNMQGTKRKVPCLIPPYHVGNEFVAVGKGFCYHQYRGALSSNCRRGNDACKRVFAYGASAMDFLYFSLSTEFIALLDACMCVHSSLYIYIYMGYIMWEKGLVVIYVVG